MQVFPFSLEKQLSEIGPDLNEAALRVLQSGKYVGGEEVTAFEESFAKLIGSNYSISCNSGTDALVLALRVLDIGPGDEVITPSFSFFATAEAISAVGATPVFVEVEKENFLVDFTEIEKKITDKSKAILPVHLFGCPVDMTRLMDISSKYGLRVIEDCAQACGAIWEGKPVGSWGDIGCFSFFPTKNLGAAGDGGAVTTDDPALAKRMRELSVHGMPRRYEHQELGYNSRLDAIQAAILNVKLPYLNTWVQKRSAIASRYIEALNDIPGLEIPVYQSNSFMLNSWNQFVIRISSSIKESKLLDPNSRIILDSGTSTNLDNVLPRDWFKNTLQKNGVTTIIYYPIPIHLQKAYKRLNYKNGDLLITEKLCSQVLSLPIYPELTVLEQDYVINTINEILIQ